MQYYLLWQHLKGRVGEHSGISPLTWKKSKSKTTTAVKDNMLFANHIVSLKDFKILASCDSKFHLEIKESAFNIAWQKKSICHITYLIKLVKLEYFLLVQSFSITTIVSLFHCNFKYCELLFDSVSFNDIWRKYTCKSKILQVINGLIMCTE